jgi:hypothetical protein
MGSLNCRSTCNRSSAAESSLISFTTGFTGGGAGFLGTTGWGLGKAASFAVSSVTIWIFLNSSVEPISF